MSQKKEALFTINLRRDSTKSISRRYTQNKESRINGSRIQQPTSHLVVESRCCFFIASLVTLVLINVIVMSQFFFVLLCWVLVFLVLVALLSLFSSLGCSHSGLFFLFLFLSLSMLCKGKRDTIEGKMDLLTLLIRNLYEFL